MTGVSFPLNFLLRDFDIDLTVSSISPRNGNTARPVNCLGLDPEPDRIRQIILNTGRDIIPLLGSESGSVLSNKNESDTEYGILIRI